MNTYEIRFKPNPQYPNNPAQTTTVDAADYARAIVAWRRAYPRGEMLWAKRKDDTPPDNRLPREPD